MGLPDRLLGRDSNHPATSSVARAIDRAEEAVVLAEIAAWRDLETLRADLGAGARASWTGVELDLALYDRGMAAADGDPVKAELVLRAVEDQNRRQRDLINRRFGS